MSDIIEAYLKQVLAGEEDIEIRRSEIADRFQCVPSQINYVINTRFTPQNGYHVESKRGGGGYIRIMKLEIVEDADYIQRMIQLVKQEIKEKDALAIVMNLYENQILSRGEAQIMLSAIDRDALGRIENADQLRAIILRNMLEKLQYNR